MTPELFERCQAQDEAAWAEVFAAYARTVYRWAVLRGLRPPEAEDAAQEALATAHRRIARCANARAFDSWLYQITRRIVANMRRLVWLRRVLPAARPIEPTFEGPRPGRETELAVRACLARLPDAQSEVLMLSDVCGYTREEVATMVGIAPGTVASRIRLGRAAFKKLWADQAPAGAPVRS